MDIGDACRVISVDGESGLGKSRLLREVRAVHANEWKCVEAHADEVSQGRPFAVWLSIIRNLLTVRMSEPEPKALGRESPLTLDDSAHELLHLSALASKVGKALDIEEEEEYDGNYSIDEDGVEWFEDEDGYWWYREEGAEDWSEYNE